MTDAELAARLYPKAPTSCIRPGPDCACIHLELRRRAVTLALLHVEYLAEQPEGLRYSAFCDRYREWLKRQSPVMRQVHLAGDKLFVDYSGMKPRLVDPLTGEVIEVELFVAVLGASNYTYAEATRTQQVADFTASVARALTFIGGCAVRYRSRSAQERDHQSVSLRSCRATHNSRAGSLLQHHDLASATEVSSGQSQGRGRRPGRRAMAARSHSYETFSSLADLNRRLFELTEIINTRPMRAYNASRRELFERLDKRRSDRCRLSLFKRRAGRRFASISTITSSSIITCTRRRTHCFDKSFGFEQPQARSRIFHLGARVTCHARSHVRNGRTTNPEHMPSTHRAHAEWTPVAHPRVGRDCGSQYARAV